MVFLHSHRNGHPIPEEPGRIDYSAVELVTELRQDFVLQEGFVNLRCRRSPGCPADIEPFRGSANTANVGEQYYAAAWKELFGNNKVPKVIGAPCCSQFAVSREAVLKRPLADYQRMYDWVLHNTLPDEVTSNIMEYTWHIIFGKDPVL